MRMEVTRLFRFEPLSWLKQRQWWHNAIQARKAGRFSATKNWEIGKSRTAKQLPCVPPHGADSRSPQRISLFTPLQVNIEEFVPQQVDEFCGMKCPTEETEVSQSYKIQ